VATIRQIRTQVEGQRLAIEPSTHSEERVQATQVQIMTWLTALGSTRREPMGAPELQLYSKALDNFPLACTERVIYRLMESERDEYESKIPALGELLAMVRSEVRKLNSRTPCGECSNGMRIVRRNGMQFAERCECWLEWQRRSGEGEGGQNL